MKEVPEKVDLEKISQACDKVMAYMRGHYMDEETMNAIGLLCTFVNRIKNNIEWLEMIVKISKEKVREDDENSNGHAA